MTQENWRNLPDIVLEDFQDWVRQGLRLRVETRKERSGETFTGEPLQKAVESALDALLALYVLERKEKSSDSEGY